MMKAILKIDGDEKVESPEGEKSQTGLKFASLRASKIILNILRTSFVDQVIQLIPTDSVSPFGASLWTAISANWSP
jgi:hypothetical protein